MNITLALGGGGARGVSHIGVLRVLEREGFRIRAVAGTSMGGVIGALYAAGNTPSDLQALVEEAKGKDLFRARPLGPGLLGIHAIETWLRGVLGDVTFEDLGIPFAVTAVDLEIGEELVLRSGKVVDAVLATIALPGIFPPRLRDDHRLIDGGVVDPVPVKPARDLFKAMTVAVALSPRREDWSTHPSPSILAQLPWLNVVSRLRPAQALRIFMRSIEISGRFFTELRLEIDKPDVIIRPAVSHIGLLDEPSVSEVVSLGEIAAEKMLPQCRAQFSLVKRLGRRFRSMRTS
ncbi:MAG TPA: patatin [Anaerolineae bacterium]|nr:patatin [Anaerolineae bacterium]